ncbi:hypothetical protein AGMMS50230_20390 [Spirochaetia bacterium]|nr:hypothetical protein AGMMS50230_20390 [Spirochaetia bacterium]
MTQNKLSFVIPCYNSSQTIENVVNNIFTVMSDKQYDFEIVLINDCSTDNLWAVIFSLAQEYSNITAINLSKNFGQHAALMAGFSYTIGSIIVCLDDDGQTSPSQVFTLVDKLNEGYDAVFAAYSEKSMILLEILAVI